VRVALLGPFEVRGDDGDRLPVAGARLRALIARLALAGGQPVSTSALAEAVWAGEPPADPANALQGLVSRARRALGGRAAIVASAAGYRLAVEPDDVDALAFERLAAAGDVEEALALWRGPALTDVGDFAAPYALRLSDLRLDATADWLARELAAGRAGAHVAELESLAASHPLNEKITALAMRALAAVGRQADALAAYERLRARLADELGIDPGEQVRAAHLEVLRGQVRPAPGPGDGGRRRRGNLRAQLTSFVGREAEIEQLIAALGSFRLVTLAGPGGAGKTRLAAQVASAVCDAGQLAPDGVWVAELASVTAASDVPQAVLDSVGLREARLTLDGSGTRLAVSRDARTRLADTLAEARALLVLDNCEHLIDACAHLADALLARCPGLRVMATSREPLGIVGEYLMAVPPLPPGPATMLFADRAAAASPGFTLAEQDEPLVAGIVRRLDGLPLAIELAAARLRTLPLAEIARRLDDRFRLLTGGSRTALPRHRTLRAVVEWSWDLLTPPERLLAERFSVFPAGATAEAVARVCGVDADAVDDLLGCLADKSLLSRGETVPRVPGPRDTAEGPSPAADMTVRLRMLETIREFGAGRLAGHADAGQVRRRHAEYYSALMNEAAPHLLTRDQLSWLRALRGDRDNILAALRYWCDEGDAARAITLSVSVAIMAFLLGNYWDLAGVFRRAAAVPGDADPGLRTIAGALSAVMAAVAADDGAGPANERGCPGLTDRIDALDFEKVPFAGLLRPAYAMLIHDEARARRYVEEGLASQDEWLVAFMWILSAGLAQNSGDMDTLRAASARALALFSELGERWGLSAALQLAASVRLMDGDLDGAAAAFSEASRLRAELGTREDECRIRLQLADIAARRGDIGAAGEFYASALAIAEAEGTGMDVAIASCAAAVFEAMTGNAERARPVLATAERELALLSPAHLARHHIAATTAEAGLMIALADGDLPLAAERATALYREGTASADMPLLASACSALAHFALALGRPERAAEILGARNAVRGGEDPTDLTAATLGPRLRDAIGREGYARAYERGRALGRAEAIAFLDPAAL
jgi:predicted ATPase/DNA-binding SARP family transcriptional activator